MKMTTKFLVGIIVLTLMGTLPLKAQMIADISESVETEFGEYMPYLVDVVPNCEPYTIEPDFSNVVNFSGFTFSDQEQEMLLANAFVVAPRENFQGYSGYKQLYDVYLECRDRSQPIFVTADFLLHTFHILYDYSLRMMEMDVFADDLNNLNYALIARAQEQYAAAADSAVQQAALKNIAFLAVGTVLRDSAFSVPSEVADLVNAELALIAAHQGYALSPIFGYPEDYSQYVPRGHYTRNETLKAYFKAMMWYGRITFAVESDFLYEEQMRELTRQAILLVQALNAVEVGGEAALTVWERIYSPTVFFVGRADDLTVYQYSELMAQVYGPDFATLPVDSFAAQDGLTQFMNLARSLPDPAIDTMSGKGFRFMGQRFIPDSYMLDQLVFPHVNDRFMPKGLDVMTVLGCQRAWEILDQFYGETGNPSYVAQMDSLRDYFDNLDDTEWAQNLYWNWLYSLMPLLFPKEEGFPMFMQNAAWADKELFCALGSWAELRHDTILYAKQSEGYTSIPPEPPFVPGYVEPNPYLWARLAALTHFIAIGLDNKGLLLEEFAWRFTDLEELLLDLKIISEKELTNQPLSQEEYILILNIGQTMEELVSFPPEVAGQIENDTDDNMAVIADVHTLADIGLCLEEGVGYPFSIFVIVPIEGQLYVTRGAVFSYYEFEQPIDDRLTDEAWQEILASDPSPEMPVWAEGFLAGGLAFLNPDPWHYYPTTEAYGIDDPADVGGPQSFILLQNYPNPFNPGTIIQFQLLQKGWIELKIYNALGELVRTLMAGELNSGSYVLGWDGKDGRGEFLASGVYFCQLKTGGMVQTRKMVLMR